VVAGTSDGAIPSVSNSSEVCGKISRLVRRRPLTDRPKRRRRLIVTAFAVTEGRKTLQIEFSAHCSRLNEIARNSPTHNLEGHSPDGPIDSVIVRLSRNV